MIKRSSFFVFRWRVGFFFCCCLSVWGCMNINPSCGVLVGKNNDVRLGQFFFSECCWELKVLAKIVLAHHGI